MLPFDSETSIRNVGVCTSQQDDGETLIAATPINSGRSSKARAKWRSRCVVAKMVSKYLDCETPALLRLLFAQAAIREMTMKELASALNVTSGFILQLNSGLKKIDLIGNGLAESVAEFLNLPRLVVLHVAGKNNLTLFSELGVPGDEFYGHLVERANQAFRDADAAIFEDQSRRRAQARSLEPAPNAKGDVLADL